MNLKEGILGKEKDYSLIVEILEEDILGRINYLIFYL